MKKIVSFIIILVFLLPMHSVVPTSFAEQEDPIPEPDGFGTSVELSKSDSTMSVANLNGLPTTAVYSFTDNIVETSIALRNSSYGTYDVYVDDDGIEYYFLYNTQMLCGCISYNFPEIADEDRIDETDALSAAGAFLSSRASNSTEFILSDSYYEECSEQYYFEFSLYVDGYKTDDNFRLWLDAAGNTIGYSEYNKSKYSNLSISDTDYAVAEAAVDAEINASYSVYEIINEYVTIDDDGSLLLIKEVLCPISTVNGDIYEVHEHYAEIRY